MPTKLLEKKDWAIDSGLLPMHLAPHNMGERYIMLDGGYYEFCLDLDIEDCTASDYNSYAWSSDVKNYIRVQGENVSVYNWKNRRCDTMKLALVEQKFHHFLKIINSTSINSSDDVTPFLLGLFAQMRNLTQETKQPIVAMNLLFKLLVSIEENNIDADVCKRWNVIDIVLPNGFDRLVDSIRKGALQIKPNLDFILRHGSGRLFEMAHRTALSFNPQWDLFGGISTELTLSDTSNYSSLHYTPRYLVRSIVENSLKQINKEQEVIRIFDPACGSGAFLQEALKQLKEQNFHGKIEVFAYDNSDMAVSTTKFLLSYEQRRQWDEQHMTYQVDVRNSVVTDWPKCDLLLMNPPYIAMELIKDSITKDAVRETLKELNMKKRPNMAAAFLYKAIKSLNVNGVLGAVLPSSLLLLEQYQSLRESIRSMFDLDIIAKLGNFAFSDALTDASIVIAKRRDPTFSIPLTVWCKNQEGAPFNAIRGLRKMQYDNLTSRIKVDYNIYTPSRFPVVGETWNTIPMKDDRLVQQLKTRVGTGDLKHLSEVFDVKQGIITGIRDIFEVSDIQYEDIPKKERKLFRNIASSFTIEDGQIKRSNYIWYPYNKRGLIIENEDQLRQYEWTYCWLAPHKTELLNRSGIKNWWEPTRSRTWQYEPAMRLCSKRFGDSSSFAIASSEFVIKDGNAFIFKSENAVKSDYYFYLAYFSSSTFEHLLSIFARTLMKGYDLGNRNIKDIPIIDVTENSGIRTTYAYQKLVELAEMYSKGIPITKEKFGHLVDNFYPGYEEEK
jgi:hypothetical protein